MDIYESDILDKIMEELNKSEPDIPTLDLLANRWLQEEKELPDDED